MLKITLGVDGMMCGMCESHVNDAVRKAFPVKKVTSSHGKGQTVILTEQDLDEQAVRDAVNATGYTVTSFSKEPYEKKGLFSLYYRVVVIRAPLQGLCYNVRDAVDWFSRPTARRFQKGSNHSPLQYC